jgi:hypothetical protein
VTSQEAKLYEKWCHRKTPQPLDTVHTLKASQSVYFLAATKLAPDPCPNFNSVWGPPVNKICHHRKPVRTSLLIVVGALQFTNKLHAYLGSYDKDGPAPVFQQFQQPSKMA